MFLTLLENRDSLSDLMFVGVDQKSDVSTQLFVVRGMKGS